MVEPLPPLRALSIPCEVEDGLSAAHVLDELSVYLECANEQQAVLGFGALLEVRSTAPSDVWPQVELITNAGATLEPLDGLSAHVPGPWFGGMAFDVRRSSAASEWAGFGLGRWIAPRLLLWRSPVSGWVLTRLLLPHDSSADARVELSQCRQLLQNVREPLGELTTVAILTRSGSDSYLQTVAAALKAIESGELLKVMVARGMDVLSPSPFVITLVLNRLRGHFPSCTTFLFRAPDGACFLGASPERLCRIADGHVQTEALAGTSRPEAAEALLHSDKDLREHAVVVEGIQKALAPLCTRVDTPPGPQLKRLPNVAHLHTPLRGTLQATASAASVIRALHPTPSVGGTPREQALRFLETHEGLARGWYAGPVGSFGAGKAELFVALRCALVQGCTARVYVGAGIVRGSTPSAELTETGLKARVLLGALNVQETESASR